MTNDKVSDYIESIEKIGFKKILEEPFYSTSHEVNETLYCFWNDKYSIFLEFDTYTWNAKGEVAHINGGYFYYNWIPNDMGKRSPVSSGGYERYGNTWVWCGYHDCRTCVEWVIKDFLSLGKFKKNWVRNPVSSICHYEDWRISGHSYGENSHSTKVTKRRFKSFPIDVQIKMNVISKSDIRKHKLKTLFEE